MQVGGGLVEVEDPPPALDPCEQVLEEGNSPLVERQRRDRGAQGVLDLPVGDPVPDVVEPQSRRSDFDLEAPLHPLDPLGQA